MDKVKLQMPSELEQAQEQIIQLQLQNHDLRQTMIDEFNRYHYWQVENEKLQAENERLTKDFKETTDGLLKILYTLADSCKKYEQALQEIRDIFSHLDEYNWFHTGKNIYMDDKCINEIKTRILTKINSVIGAE